MRPTRGVPDTHKAKKDSSHRNRPLTSLKKRRSRRRRTDGIDVCDQEKICQEEQRGVAVSQDQLPVPGRLLRLREVGLRGLLAPALR